MTAQKHAACGPTPSPTLFQVCGSGSRRRRVRLHCCNQFLVNISVHHQANTTE